MRILWHQRTVETIANYGFMLPNFEERDIDSGFIKRDRAGGGARLLLAIAAPCSCDGLRCYEAKRPLRRDFR